ncbi:tripartite tricarboxylate transporter substrate binding protein [Roseomonas sp. CAU 1739]|uniref:Bug family tripartite tricarboxylate transporter substrate binding protein n=1 Tax=Roseomonas sp. CAU 1739 TaxID=3140364 RepID=UPI00325B2AAB
MLTRRTMLAAAGVLAAPRLARAAWPADRPIEVIVPYPPSGGGDTQTRFVISHVARQMPHARFVVQNRAGAGGQLGFEANFNAAPDGYTFGLITNTALHGQPLERRVRFRPRDFSFIANVVFDPTAFWVAADSPFRNLDDLVAAARRAPETIGVGTAGVGSDDHLLMMAFEELTDTRLLHVPYNGTAPTLRDLLGGRLPIGGFNAGEGGALYREGKIRCIGQSGAERWSGMPEVPTFREQGFDLISGSARGYAGPPGLPPDILEGFRTAFAAAMDTPEFRADAVRLGLPIQPLIGEAYRRMMAEEDERMQALWRRRPWREG